MAQLKDALITGDARVLGKLYADQSLPDGVFHLANIGGTAAVTSSPYTSAKWYTTTNDPRITSLYSGLTISLKIPVAGVATYGVLLNVNGLGDHPVVYNVNSNISTRYAVGGTIMLTYNATQTATGYNNSASATTYTGCWQLEDYDYDSTNIYQLRDNGAQLIIGSSAGALYRYELVFMNKAGQGVPYNNQSNKATTYNKSLNSNQSFDPFAPIYYYNSTTTVNAGSGAAASALYTHINFDCRYAMNIQSDGTAGSTALTAHAPVYIVATYNESSGNAYLVNNTSATSYLDRSSIVQAFPESNLEGKILIYLGRAYSKYQIELSVTHPVYKWSTTGNTWKLFVGHDADNIMNGSAAGSVRTLGSSSESSSYTIGSYAFAEGYATKASGSYSHAEGYSTTASNQYDHAEGRGTTASGGYSHAEGQSSTASATFAHAEGNGTTASGSAAHAEGASCEATAAQAHAEGYMTKATSQYAHAEGRGCIANANQAHAEGDYSVSLGGASHAEGANSYTSNTGSHAEGMHITSNIVSGTITAIDEANLKVTVGSLPQSGVDYQYQLFATNTSFYGNQYITAVTGSGTSRTFTLSKWISSLVVDAAFNVRYRCTAIGAGSHAEGQGTRAEKAGSHAEGTGTITSVDNQHVEGKWNATGSSYAHIVGNGTAYNARSNAYTLDWSGNGIYAGKLTVGSGPTNNMDVATKQYVDNNHPVYVGSSAPASGSSYTVWVDTSGTVNNAAVVNACYPVGAIYMSTSSTNPGTALGTGTWEAYSPNPYTGIYMWKRTA